MAAVCHPRAAPAPADAVVDLTDDADAAPSGAAASVAPRDHATEGTVADARAALVARALARCGALSPVEHACIARQDVDVLQLLADGHAYAADVFAAEARAHVDEHEAPRAAWTSAAADDSDVEIVGEAAGDEPAWRARARAALEPLVAKLALTPCAQRRAALDALDAVLRNAAAPDALARGRRSVSVAALARRVRGAPAAAEGAERGAPARRLSGAHASPADAADADAAAAGRCVQAVVTALESAGWYIDSADGDAATRLLLLAEPRTEPGLLRRASELLELIVQLRDAADAAEAAHAAPKADGAAALSDDEDDPEAAAAAWAALAAEDAAKVARDAAGGGLLATQAPAWGGDADELSADDAAAGSADATSFDDAAGGSSFDEELWQRYSSRAAPLAGAGRAGLSAAPYDTLAASQPMDDVAAGVGDDAAAPESPVVALSPPPKRAAVPPPPPQCRVLLRLPGGGSARLALPPSATLLDVYAAASTHLQRNAGTAPAGGAPALLAQHDWAAAPQVDLLMYRLVRPQPAPARVFAAGELARLSLADAGAFPSGLFVLERAGAGGVRAAPVGAFYAGGADVLRVTDARGKPSPIVHLKNLHGDSGASLFAKLRPLLPAGWSDPAAGAGALGGQYTGFPKVLLLHNALWADGGGMGGFGATNRPLAHRAAVPLQDYAEAALRMAAGAVRAQHSNAVRASDRAADDLLKRRPFLQASGLLYTSNGKLHDHVDNVGTYLVLLSLGCTLDFLVDGRVIVFRSGDALIFNGGPAHGVMHGVRNVHPRTCPGSLPHELRTARLSLQLRQQ